MTKHLIGIESRHDWISPDEIFNPINDYYQFDLDAAASFENSKCLNYFGLDKGQNSLQMSWGSGYDIWLNPPYGQQGPGEWLDKAYYESQKDNRVVCLVKAATDTKWWSRAFRNADQVVFLTPRVQFIHPDGISKRGNNHGSCLFIFGKLLFDPVEKVRIWDWRNERFM